MSTYDRDTWLTPIVITSSNKRLVINEDYNGTPDAIQVNLTEGTYYLHDDSSFHSTKPGLYYAIRNVLNNGTGSDGTLTGSPANTYSWEASDPSSSDGITNGGVTLKAASASQEFEVDFTAGTDTTMDGRWLGHVLPSPVANVQSATSGSDEVIISANCAFHRFVTHDLGDGAARDKSGVHRKRTRRSSDRLSDAVTLNWGEDLLRQFSYEDVFPALVDRDRSSDAPYAAQAGLNTGDKHSWYWVWAALTDGDEVIVVHDASDLQVDGNEYEIVKLAEERIWDQFQIPSGNGGDLRNIRFLCWVDEDNSDYNH